MAGEQEGGAPGASEGKADATPASGAAPVQDGAAPEASGGKGGAEAGRGGDGKPDPAAASDDKGRAAFDWQKDLPADLRGKDERETIERLFNRGKEAREFISKFGLPPKEAAEYEFKPNEKTAPFLGEKGDIELANKALDVLAKAGVPKLLGAPVLNGLMEMLADFEVVDQPIDVAAERLALLPAEGKVFSKAEQDAMIDRRIHKNKSFVSALAAEGFDDAELAPIIAGLSTAAGNRLVEKLAERMGAVNPMTGGSYSAPASLADTRKLGVDLPFGDISKEAEIEAAYKRQFNGR